MKIYKILTLILSVFATQTFAQTKLIAHKSHSGSSASFKIAMENDPLQYEGSNFGAAPERYVTESQLDSVVYVHDSLAIMYTSNFFKRMYYPHDTFRPWQPGREAVYKHPLFSQRHSLDKIKEALKEDYYFRNSIEDVKFVGYDNIKPVDRKEKKDTLLQPLVNKGKKDTVITSRKRHTANRPILNNDIIWLLEIISLVAMATGATLIKLKPY